MTTAPVLTITEELVAELEALAENAKIARSGNPWFTQDDCCWWTGNPDEGDFMSAASPATILALLSERAELKRDAERFKWLLENADMMHWENMLHYADLEDVESIREFIDTAMQERQE